MTTSTSATDLLSQRQPSLKPRSRVRRMPSQWQALLEEFNDCGLTKSAFCKKHRIAVSSFYRWQQYFANQVDDEATDFIDVTQPLSAVTAPHTIQARDNDWQVELELGTGVVLRLRTL